MLEAVKEYLTPKRFGTVSYMCLIVHLVGGLIITGITSELRKSDNVKFVCLVDSESTVKHKLAEKTCYSRYEQTHNSLLPLYGFTSLSTGIIVLVSVVYVFGVYHRTEQIEEASNGSDDQRTESEEANRGLYIFYFYFIHLVVRMLFGILFTILQHKVFFPNGFDFQFSCNLPSTKAKNASAGRLITCENSTASEKNLWGVILSVLNSLLALAILVEVIYLWRRFPVFSNRSQVDWSSDFKFVTKYFLRRHVRQYANVRGDEFKLTNLNVNTVRSPDLEDLFVDFVIQTGRAPHNFSKNMTRHEMYDVYMEVPAYSIRLDKIKDLFYPNKDTKRNSPRTILVVGRPGIGKTFLTEKIVEDCTKEIHDEFYRGKTAFLFKFRWWLSCTDEFKNISLKTFLSYVTKQSEERFKRVFDEILKKPAKAILIFDGLDELNVKPTNCLAQSKVHSNDPNTCMSAISLFMKLVAGDLLPGATVLVTSRPTAAEFYSSLKFDRNVEIVGFTTDKIKMYISKFCEKHNIENLESKIWNHINSSSDLLNLCYIPQNCSIICVTLSESLSDIRNESSGLPTTLTELYQTATDYFNKHHNKCSDKTSSEQIEKLQALAFRGMENRELIFEEQDFDDQMKKSGLLNSLSNPIKLLRTQFCFIHLTIQEFLAAKYVIETLVSEDLKTFISSHIGIGKWHLVLQFIAGLLGQKKTIDSKYEDCIFAFANVFPGEVIHLYKHDKLCAIKYLREVGNEDIVKKACDETDLKFVSTLEDGFSQLLSASDWAAVTFVCKHLNNLKHLKLLNLNDDHCRLEVSKLLQPRCLETLSLSGRPVSKSGIQCVTRTLSSKCILQHEHSKLNKLELRDMNVTDAGVSDICGFIKNGHGSHLQELNLVGNEISSFGMAQLSEILNNELCGELRCLNFSGNDIGDEGVHMLGNALTQGHCKITTLKLAGCSLTAKCMCWLSEVLQHEHCDLTALELGDNKGVGDEGVRVLCEGLGKKQCKLTKLILDCCSLTTRSAVWLSDVLQLEHCELTYLALRKNKGVRDEGVRVLCKALGKKGCKLTKLDLAECSLTARSVDWLSEVFQNEHCKLTVLLLSYNAIGDKGARILCENALTKEHCKLTKLGLYRCELTGQSEHLLRKTMEDHTHLQVDYNLR